jgi:diguanylate cyclase (GGDEF)-like protein/putative nucleotidyltransferase with HDIG domain
LIVTLLAGGATCIWATTKVFAISTVRWPEFTLLVAFGITTAVAGFITYKIQFDGITTKSREAEELNRLHFATVEALATAIDAKDQTSHCHVRRVQIYAKGLGELLGLSAPELDALNAGALLHDVGKLAVPDHILNKPGALTAAEYERTKLHTIVGAEIMDRVGFPYPVVPIIRHHHERWDGRGYPDGLRGEQIPITARIMSVVDCFDSVREDRPFRRRMTRDEAVDLLRSYSHTRFDPELVELFVRHLPEFEAQISARGLDYQITASATPIADVQSDRGRQNGAFTAYNQIRNAHREVYALYEIARTFGSSLEVENTLSVLVDKVGHLVPFDSCVVYLYDTTKGYASAALAVGLNAATLGQRCVGVGEGVTGFVLANRRAINQLHPSLEFAEGVFSAECSYQGMASLPLLKNDILLGALSIYSTELTQYTDDQLRLLETVTRLASDALANAMHHAVTQSNALTDALTGLPNARSLHARFDEEVARSQRTGRPFQVIMLDLDDFKLVNDTFGHKVGDRMLREVAALVNSQFREYDFLARYAGDEFVAIVPDVATDQVEELRQRIEKLVSEFCLDIRSQGRARVGISVGSAVYGRDGQTLDQLLVAADQAMYRAKSAHKAESLIAKIPESMPLEPTPNRRPEAFW